MTIYDFNELVLKLLNEPYEDLVRAIKIIQEEIDQVIKKLFVSEETDINTLYFYHSCCIIGDRKISDLERKLILDTTDYEEDELDSLFEYFQENEDKLKTCAKTIFSGVDLNIQSKIIVYCACFLAVDKTTPIDEIEFIQELLEGE